MLEFLRGLHNLLRWVIVLGGVAAVVLMARGVVTRAAWTARESGVARVFTYGLHLQFLVGLILYAITPLLAAGITAPLSERLLLIEHAVIMLFAVVAAQLGTSLARRATVDAVKFRRSLIGYGVAMLFILWATPWGKSLIPWVG